MEKDFVPLPGIQYLVLIRKGDTWNLMESSEPDQVGDLVAWALKNLQDPNSDINNYKVVYLQSRSAN